MPRKTQQDFPKNIHKDLGVYVYRLVDPRTGLTFYIGRGRENRVFDHVNQALNYRKDEDATSAKMDMIQKIKNVNLEPIHIIHRHGLDEEAAKEVEAALIDASGDLTNVQGGQGSADRGPANAAELITKYAKKVVKPQHKIVALNVSKSTGDKSHYDAARFAWRISVKRARKAEYVIAVVDGVCRNVFTSVKWFSAMDEEFKGFPQEGMEKRHGFVGEEAPQKISDYYVNKRLPPRDQGESNPVRYYNVS